MLIQIHILQNYAPSNLNRDDTGSPKDAVFGGVQRGRISSQCLKRSIRYSEAFKVFDAEGLLGKRTKTLPVLLQSIFDELKVNDETAKAILSRLPAIIRGSTKGDKKGDDAAADDEDENDIAEPTSEAQGKEEEVKQLVFLDVNTELRAFAQKFLDAYKTAGGTPKKWESFKIKELMKALGESLPRSIDIAMFGRMTTSQAFKNVQASVQVAHALSANALKTEFDYYTAMDDLKPDGVPGADMIGDVEFNSCTYYKYINVSWKGLLDNLGGKESTAIAKRTVLALLEAAATAHPSGKQNSFGAFSPADFVFVEVSERNLPVSYVNAFVTPVNGNNYQSLLKNSVATFSTYAGRLIKAYSLGAQRAYMSVEDFPFMDLKAQPSLEDLKQWLAAQLPQ